MSEILISVYRLAYYVNNIGIPIMPELIKKIFVRLFGCQLRLFGIKLGKNVELGNGGLGIVIHRHAILKNRIIIAPNVTIGENYFIRTCAKILASIRIGNNYIMGVNAVVLKDIPDNCVTVGILAEVIKTNINIKNYK